MAASSSSSSAQPDHHQRTDASSHPRVAKHRRHHVDHLQVQVPPTSSPGCFVGCFRPSPSSASAAVGHHHGNAHADRPASPSLIRSPTAWIRSLGSGSKHARHRSRDFQFQYDAASYARNFDEGSTDGGEGEEDDGTAASDAVKYRFSSRLPTSPPARSPSGLGPGKGMEPAHRPGRDWD